MRRCEQCKASIEGKRSDALYCRDLCRVTASKARRGLAVPAVPTRSGGPSGLQVSYRKTVERMATIIGYYQPGYDKDLCRHLAEGQMRELLSPAQRARLEARS